MYLKINKSPRLAVVVNVGAVSAVNSYVAFHVKVLDPVPSWINVSAINWPAAGVVPEGAAIVLLAPNVTFATGEAITSQAIVAWSVNVSSTFNTAPVILVNPLASAVKVLDAALVPNVEISL